VKGAVTDSPCNYDHIKRFCTCRALVTTSGVLGREHLRTAFPHHIALDLTDVLATGRFALLVKRIQWNRKIKCEKACKRKLTSFELIGAVFLFIWVLERRSRNSF